MISYNVYALGAILCWASLPAATGSGLSELSTVELMFYSFSFAAFYLYVQGWVVSRNIRVRFPGVKACAFGIWGIFLYHYIYYLALERAPLAEAAILATTWSLWIVIFSSVLQLKRLAPAVMVSAVLGFVGAAQVIGAGKELEFHSTHMQGYLLALCCGLIWSSFSVGLPRLKLRHDPMTGFTILTALCSGALFLMTMPHKLPSNQALISAMYLGFVPLGLSFFLWNKAVSGGNLVVIGFLSYLTPPLAVLLVAIIHRQTISRQVISGMLLILVASIMGNYFQKKLSRKLQACPSQRD